MFTELSVSEQEVIAGGLSQTINASNFLSSFEGFSSTTNSNAHGTSTQTTGVRDQRFSSGVSAVTFGAILGIPILPFPTFA
ncbi:hypothetical protein B6N60_04158 [Richelia sinica FACHB-800]|uniref:Bacteriocin n=1 Tax=Richelia sinica FACHB-800 TaxID=1357546 RepID=A0A975TAX5_9NOST|nr:hypothetical protein B6N60_04158 [Richelia sinica FACHB-800]